MITHNPLHRSVRAEFPHTAPASGDDAHSLQRIGMANGGWRKPAINKPIHSFPSDALATPAHTERVVPIAAYLESKSLDGLCIGWHPVIADKATHHGAEPFPLPGNRLMHAPSEFGLEPFTDQTHDADPRCDAR